MGSIVDSIIDGVDAFLAWGASSGLKQSTGAYFEVETADGPTVLAAYDGSLISIIEVQGVRNLIGRPEFDQIHEGLNLILQTAMTRPGHALQVLFNYDQDTIENDIQEIFAPAAETAKRLQLNLGDLFLERQKYLADYCAQEKVYFVLWTKPTALSKEQQKEAADEKLKTIRDFKQPKFLRAQNIFAAIPILRDTHQAYVRSIVNELQTLNIAARLLEVHEAVQHMRMIADPDFTSPDWRALLPGDKCMPREVQHFQGDPSDLLWPSLAKQVLPRDVEVHNLRVVQVGDRHYSFLYIDLFPQDIKPFVHLFSRALSAHIPWRISYLIESEGLGTLRFKSMLATILSFSSQQNRLLSDANNLLNYIRVNTDDAVVRLRVVACTWAPANNPSLLSTRQAELSKALQSWGGCDVSEICGDAFEGMVSTLLGVTAQSPAVPSVAPLSDVITLLPFTRPASTWAHGSLLFRTPDGKPWPFEPGSSQQTTWIDLIYARPGSGKSVLSNALNLGLCLQAGISRLPRIAVIDIGPSSSGLISLLREALPQNQRHLVSYHRLRMTPEYSINPFDTQLGARFPNPSERAFLVNFITLLATPLGAEKPYDAIPDLAGIVVDELYKTFANGGNPTVYTADIEPIIDAILDEIGFVKDAKTTWWEITDALFIAGFVHEASMAQRYAMPLLADAASIVRSSSIEDLYGKIIAPTGESLINAFARMISSAVREYPILSKVTAFDLGDARIVSMDLDEVAKTGGDAADRQTAVMYMLARYALAKHYYLNENLIKDFPQEYQEHHRKRIFEIREDPKRIVYDEFHRTSKSKAVRDQVIVDMREGRKWKVQVGLLSQSVDDFDSVMIEFATGVYIMDAGPAAAQEKTAQIFGLSETARYALRTRVHGPREGGATFLAIFSTKFGMNTQLLTLTLGPMELWAFSTTAEDATIRNRLYQSIGPQQTRRLLARMFPSGSVVKVLEHRLLKVREDAGFISDESRVSEVEQLYFEILDAYSKNPDVAALPVGPK